MFRPLPALSLLATLLGLAPGAWPQTYYPPAQDTYHQVDRETVVGSDGRVYVRRGHRLILVDDVNLHRPRVDLPPGSRIVGHIADSVMIETSDGKRQTCTPVGGQTICH